MTTKVFLLKDYTLKRKAASAANDAEGQGSPEAERTLADSHEDEQAVTRSPAVHDVDALVQEVPNAGIPAKA